MKAREFRASGSRKPFFLRVLVWAALLWNSYAYAACGPIPNTYPLFGGSGFTTDKDWTVNSLPAGKGAKITAAPVRTAVDASGNVTNTAQSLPDISPAAFVASGAAAGTNTSTSIAAGDYDNITKPAGGATTFTGGIYHINVLGNTSSNVDNWTITMAPGDYFIDKVDLHDSDSIVLSGSGVVRIYIKTYFNVHNLIELNNGGTTQNLQIFMYPAATATFNDKTILNGLIYAPGSTSTISFHNSDNSHTYTGAIITGGTLDFSGGAEVVNYNAATKAAIGAISTCTPVSASKSTMSASPKTIPADNITTSTITVTLKDTFGTPVSGKVVTLSQGAGSSTISAASGPSNASGVVTFTVRNSIAQSVLYTATDTTDGITVAAQSTVNFTPSAAASTVVASPTSVPADNTTTSTITVTLKDGAGNPVSGKIVTLTAGSGSSTIAPASTSTNVSGVATFTVKDGVVESVTYTAKDATDNLTITQTATVSFTAVVASFNVVEPSAHPVSGNIFTKIAGQNFVLDIVARKADNTLATGFTGTVLVEVVDNTNSGSVACKDLPVVAALANPSQVFSAGDAGRHSLFTPNPVTTPNTVANAYRNVVVRVSFPTGTPTVISCSTDNFAIRPATLSFMVQDANRTTEGATNTLSNTALAGATVHNAGRPFRITATGYNGAGAPALTSNYAGTPAAVLTPCGDTACTATAGNLTACVDLACTTTTADLSLAAWTASSGTVTLTTAAYDDVGAFNLQLQDSKFAIVDSGDGTPATCSNTAPVGSIICSAALGVGRFVPDRFLLSAASIVPRSDIAACSGSSFTYMGERMDANFTLTAVRFPSGTTTRYAGTLGRLVLSSPAALNFGAIDSAGPTVLGARLATSPAPLGTSGTWTNGVGAVVAVVAVNRNATPDGPFNSLKLGIAPSDPDAVALDPAAINLDADNNGSSERAQIGATDVRFGRLKLQNANGSSLIAMPVPITAQYWNGTGFVTNTLDSCTSLTPANVALGNFQKNLNSGETTVTTGGAFSAGVGTLRLSAPGATNNGSVEVSVNLTGSTAGASCTAGMPASTGTSRSYLQGAWCGATYVNDPTARATFGVYRNSDRFIYQRENF